MTATSMGMDADRSLDLAHSGEGTQAAYESTSERIRQGRCERTAGGYNEADRRRQEDADR